MVILRLEVGQVSDDQGAEVTADGRLPVGHGQNPGGIKDRPALDDPAAPAAGATPNHLPLSFSGKYVDGTSRNEQGGRGYPGVNDVTHRIDGCPVDTGRVHRVTLREHQRGEDGGVHDSRGWAPVAQAGCDAGQLEHRLHHTISCVVSLALVVRHALDGCPKVARLADAARDRLDGPQDGRHPVFIFDPGGDQVLHNIRVLDPGPGG